jgi:dipeptidyl aminopeptidase/acylaminoacyl peptidase
MVFIELMLNRRASRVGVAFAVAVFIAVALLASTTLAAFPGKNGRIAYTAADGSIHTMLPSGKDDAPLGQRSSSAPEWAPDGERLAFVLGGERWNTWANIYMMSADGSQTHQITASTHEDNLSPSYAPGGNRILFTTQDYYDSRFLHIYDPDPRPHIRDLKTRDRQGYRLGGAVWAPNGKITYTLRVNRRGGDTYRIWTHPRGWHPPAPVDPPRRRLSLRPERKDVSIPPPEERPRSLAACGRERQQYPPASLQVGTQPHDPARRLFA